MGADIRQIRFGFGTAALIGLALVLCAPDTLYAQSYPGLSAPSAQQRAGQPPPGYGGLTQSAPARTAVRGVIGEKKPDQQPEPLPAVSAGNAPATPANIKQSFAPGQFGDMAVRSPEQLKIAALIAESAKAGPVNLNGRRLPDSTLSILNQPQVKQDGMWPKEARAINYVQSLYNDIRNSPPAARRDKIEAARRQITAMIDANLAQLAAPDDVSLQLGMTRQAVQETKAAAAATNERLNTALQQLK